MADDDNSAIAALQRVAAARRTEPGTATEESRGSRANPNPFTFLDDATLQRIASDPGSPHGGLAAWELRLRGRFPGPRGHAMTAANVAQIPNPDAGVRTVVPDQILRTSEPYGPWRTNAQIDHVLRMNPVTPDERNRVGWPLMRAYEGYQAPEPGPLPRRRR